MEYSWWRVPSSAASLLRQFSPSLPPISHASQPVLIAACLLYIRVIVYYIYEIQPASHMAEKIDSLPPSQPNIHAATHARTYIHQQTEGRATTTLTTSNNSSPQSHRSVIISPVQPTRSFMDYCYVRFLSTGISC